MANIWCISAPLFSHTDWGGFLKTAQALTARGHRVLWVSEESLRGAVEGTGTAFAAIERSGWLWPPPPVPDVSAMPPAEAVMLRYRRALDTWMSEDLVGAGVNCLLKLAREIGPPDIILSDPFLSAAALAAESLDLPLVVCGWLAQRELRDDFLFPVQRTLGSESRERLDRLQAQFELDGAYFAPGPTPSILSQHLHLCYFTRSWYAADEDSILPQTLFVGGKADAAAGAPPAWLTDIPREAPIALITLGTTFMGDLGFYAWAAQAAARVGYVPVVVIGIHPFTKDEKASLKAALPKTTRLLNFAPFDHLLPRTRLIFHHGGMGTTHAALLHGIPQIVVPHAADQRGQARRVAQAKVGLHLTAHDVKQGMLYTAARALRDDAAVQANAHDLAQAMAASGGAARAAEVVELVL